MDDVEGPVSAGGPPSAQEIAAAVAAALRGPETAPLWPALDGYLADLAARTCPRHFAITARMLRAMREACPGPTTAEVFVWRSAALRRGSAKTTVNHYTGRLRSFAAWAAKAGIVTAHPCEKLAPLPVTAKDLARRPRAFNDAEIAAFLAAVREIDRHTTGVDQEPMWRLLAESGLRWSEAAELVARDLRGDVLRVAATITKAKRERSVVLPAYLVAHFGALTGPLLKARRGGSWKTASHSSIHRSFRGLMESAGIPRHDAAGRLLTIHSLRRTAGTTWAKEGLPLLHVSRLLGHANTAFTERWYLDNTSEDAVAALRSLREEAEKEARPENASP